MKKIFFLALICVAALASSNSISAQGRWGVIAGADYTTLKFSQSLTPVDEKIGGVVGITGELMMPGIGFGVDASILYTQRGGKIHFGDQKIWSSLGYGNESCTLHYIEIPIHLKFKYTNLNGVENIIAPIVFAGPSFTILAGHSKIDALSYAGGEFGVQVGVGAELFRKFQINGSRCWGMTYALKTKLLDDYSAKNRTWKVTLTYFF